MTTIRIRAWRAVTVGFALFTCASGAYADKTDVIELRNGDRITCEIKRLERGRLQVSTDSLGTLYMEWEDIARVTSKELYVVELEDGTRLEGTLSAPTADAMLDLAGEEGTQRIAMEQVVWMDPLRLDAMRIRRWDGSVSAGFDKTKANDDTSLSAKFDGRRRGEDFLLNLDGSIYSRSQDEAEDSVRANLAGLYRGLLEERWYWAGLGSVERNDELGIDLRSLAGVGYGRFLVQTGRSLWSLTGGAALVNEQRAGTEGSETSVEAFVSTDYEFFTYDTPKTSVTTSLTVYPSLTESGRVRSDVELGLRRELITDFFVELSLYHSYDRKPPEEGEKTDYGIVTGLGYTF